MALEKSHNEKEFENGILYLIIILNIALIAINIIFHFQEEIIKILSVDSRNYFYKGMDYINVFNKKYNLLSSNSYQISINLFLLLALATTTGGVEKSKLPSHHAKYYLGVGFIFLIITHTIIVDTFTTSKTPFLLSIIIYSIGCIIPLFCFNIAGSIANSNTMPQINTDMFNDEAEQFPQNQKRYDTENSVLLQTEFVYQNRKQTGLIPIIAPQRGVGVLGSQGSGKTASVLVPALWQSIAKGCCTIVYDEKYPDLTNEAYNATINALAKNKNAFGDNIIPTFIDITFDQPHKTFRFNPLADEYIQSMDDAFNISITFMDNINRTWKEKEGSFFEESAKNYFAMVIYYFKLLERKYNNLPNNNDRLDICTLPHVIEAITGNEPKYLLNIIRNYPELANVAQNFLQALEGGANDQIMGQIGSISNVLVRLATPTVYWVLSGGNSINVNDIMNPVQVCIGNSPVNKKLFAPCCAIIIKTFMRKLYDRANIENSKKIKTVFIIDEFPSIYIDGFDAFLNTIRSYNVSTYIGIQDFEQLSRDYSQKNADVIINTLGTIVSGNVNFKTAEKVSTIFGETMQAQASTTFADNKTSIQLSNKKEKLLPPSKIMQFSTGEFAGKMADTYDKKIERKVFKSNIIIPVNQIKKKYNYNKETQYTKEDIRINFMAIKGEVDELLYNEMLAFNVQL